jgi:hypothetical protein
MTVTLVMVLAILATLALGFLRGRIWQIRCDELQRRAGIAPPLVARSWTGLTSPELWFPGERLCYEGNKAATGKAQ